jgi:type VI secretion system protein ImpK
MNKLVECASPIFHLASAFRVKDRGASLNANFRDKIINALDQLEHHAFEQQIAMNKVQQAKYALAAFIDELVLSSSWPGRNDWMGTPLQLQFFGEHLAGEGFFKRLQELRQNPGENVDVLEVFYICLQLGFEGVYRMKGLEQLLALQGDLRSQIELIRGIVDPKLSPAGIPTQSMATKMGARLPFWVIGSATAAILFFIYLGYAIAIDHQANKALASINQSKNILLQELK